MADRSSRVQFAHDENEVREEKAVDEEDGLAARRRFCLPLFVPSLLQGKSTAVVTPMLPLFIMEDLGGSVATVGAVASAYSLAQVLSSVPMGFLLAKFSHRTSAMVALAVIVASSYTCSVCTSVLQFVTLRLVSGVAANSWNLSRKVWIAAEVPKSVRGRITGTLTGLSRWAGLLGALLGGGVAEYVRTREVFIVQACFSLSALLVLAGWQWSVRSEPVPPSSAKLAKKQSGEVHGVCEVLKASWYPLATAGVYCLMLNGCRQTWLIVLPLQCKAIGLTKMDIGAWVAAGKFVDGLIGMTVSGAAMDRYGRKAVGVPAMVIISFAYFLSTWGTTKTHLLVASLVYGLGNGLTGGIASTLSADLAPAWARAEFMGLWKMTTSNGSLVFPLLFGILSDTLGSIDAATWLLQSLGIMSAFWLLFVVPETVKSAEPPLLDTFTAVKTDGTATGEANLSRAVTEAFY
eukprot:TRINITY_DN23366_c0_g2_i1.p1 TRINITY_DN23366_c0_g2~~TRINITY_DN23366_c0_g2_i1.p1  ORF type:complete len:470 (-),score=58.72 TRINITY_DN23366_c0_g2_i1:296-1681(-)